jgi:hypothetical protein
MAVVQIGRKWGNGFITREDAKTEFNLYAWRIARLRRALVVAGDLKDETLRSKAVALIHLETERHERRLSQLSTIAPTADAGAPLSSLPKPARTHTIEMQTGGQL